MLQLRAIAVAVCASGCSFAAAPTVPPREAWATTTAGRCERASGALGADFFGFFLTAPLAPIGVYAAGLPASESDDHTVSGSRLVAGAVILAIPAVLYAASIGYGLHADHLCTEYDDFLDARAGGGR